jgi:hypothetical protein
MSYAVAKRAIGCALSLGLLTSAAVAGGYGGGSGGGSPIASQEANAILAYGDRYQDGNFRVEHREVAGAEVKTGAAGESAFGYGSSVTNIETDAGATSWKRSIQRSDAHATNGAASANGFTASFVKVRTDDGKYYIFKGMASTGASAGPGGTSTNASGIAKSKAGRY